MKAIALASLVSCLVVACATGTYAPESSRSDGGIISKGDGGTSLPKNDGGTPPGDDAGPTNTCTETLCGADCVDTSSDPLNCGACGNVCDVSSTCTGGQCVPSTQGSGEPPQGTCSHSLCTSGNPLILDCDPAGCTDVLCDPDFGIDPICCDSGWDSICVQEVTDYCAPYSCN